MMINIVTLLWYKSVHAVISGTAGKNDDYYHKGVSINSGRGGGLFFYEQKNKIK